MQVSAVSIIACLLYTSIAGIAFHYIVCRVLKGMLLSSADRVSNST